MSCLVASDSGSDDRYFTNPSGGANHNWKLVGSLGTDLFDTFNIGGFALVSKARLELGASSKSRSS